MIRTLTDIVSKAAVEASRSNACSQNGIQVLHARCFVGLVWNVALP